MTTAVAIVRHDDSVLTINEGPEVCPTITGEELETLFRLASEHGLTRRCDRCVCWCLYPIEYVSGIYLCAECTELAMAAGIPQELKGEAP